MRHLSAAEAFQAALDSPLFAKRRNPSHEGDFGDQATVGHKLKRNGGKTETDFSIYLGQHDDEFIVAIINYDNSVTAGIAYPSIETLKQTWELD